MADKRCTRQSTNSCILRDQYQLLYQFVNVRYCAKFLILRLRLFLLLTVYASLSISTDSQLATRTPKYDFIRGVTSSNVYLSDPQFVRSTATDKPVIWVTCLGEEVFVEHDSKAEVEVYDVNTLIEQRRITVAGTNNSWNMTSCFQNKCLFIIRYGGERVYRVDMNGRATSWKVNGSAYDLSMTAKWNAHVTLFHHQHCKSSHKTDNLSGRLFYFKT